jgi:hypothetical protein
MTVVLLVLGLFLLGAVGFSTDIANLWFHRQVAQDAADAACTAGAMDLLADPQGKTYGNWGAITTGTSFTCSSMSGAAPCRYAALNGYSGSGLTSGSPSNDVAVSFPPAGSNPAPGVAAPPPSVAPIPFIRVDIVDRVKVIFAGMMMGSRTADVRAFAVCGVGLAQSPIPILVLDPQNPPKRSALDVQGTPLISILGGPSRSIQVNSNASTAINIGGSASINLTKGGPNFDGSDLGVFGGPTTAPSGFHTAGSGAWRFPSSPISDPFAQIPTPAVPSAPSVPADLALNLTCNSSLKIQSGSCKIAYHNAFHGCPDPAGCTFYAAGYYPTGITVKNETAIFDPGLYSLNGGLALQANSAVRPGTGTGDGNGGTVFYLTGATQECSGQEGLVCVGSNSGKAGLNPFNTALVQCPGGPAPDARLNLPATLDGNVMLAPCTGTYGGPLGQYRGILFFQDRANNVGGGWGGGGGFLLAGSMYFHHCNASGTGTSCGAAPSFFDSNFQLQGNSGSASYILGEIVTDNLSLGGTPSINMALNPNAAYTVLKASLYR